ncbi:hypothetical protein POTOM_060248 (mitochondrion) [Populus tomentosa]|uniref:Uncharacterized protein n=1 Tax=Populus tomentosa TaxID=118781 RepID=A0A8X7Y0E8_POPTO|nr:hypothetical protein POTOM_060248 [Populus tomentosa]
MIEVSFRFSRRDRSEVINSTIRMFLHLAWRLPVQHGLHASSFDPINSCRRQSSAQGTRPYAKHLFHIELIFPYDLELVIVCQEGSALPDFPTKAELWEAEPQKQVRSFTSTSSYLSKQAAATSGLQAPLVSVLKPEQLPAGRKHPRSPGNKQGDRKPHLLLSFRLGAFSPVLKLASDPRRPKEGSAFRPYLFQDGRSSVDAVNVEFTSFVRLPVPKQSTHPKRRFDHALCPQPMVLLYLLTFALLSLEPAFRVF